MTYIKILALLILFFSALKLGASLYLEVEYFREISKTDIPKSSSISYSSSAFKTVVSGLRARIRERDRNASASVGDVP